MEKNMLLNTSSQRTVIIHMGGLEWTVGEVFTPQGWAGCKPVSSVGDGLQEGQQ
jgi:hypothetical protein